MSAVQTEEKDKVDLTAELFLARINEKYDLEKAILFGRCARHEAGAQSDMDIGSADIDRKQSLALDKAQNRKKCFYLLIYAHEQHISR